MPLQSAGFRAKICPLFGAAAPLRSPLPTRFAPRPASPPTPISLAPPAHANKAQEWCTLSLSLCELWRFGQPAGRGRMDAGPRARRAGRANRGLIRSPTGADFRRLAGGRKGKKERILIFEKCTPAGHPNCEFRPPAGRPKQEIVRKKGLFGGQQESRKSDQEGRKQGISGLAGLPARARAFTAQGAAWMESCAGGGRGRYECRWRSAGKR